jgi:3-hydroxybutyryl-CoA dehydrogenase
MRRAEEIARAAVLGSGTMGHGIAQVCALAGIAVRVYDVQEAALDQARAKVRASLDQGVAKGKVAAAARDTALAALEFTTELGHALERAEVVIEAVPEKLDLKCALFEQLGRLSADVLLATNTSSLSVARIAAAAAHPERVVGMHFFNPVHIMKLVEVVRAERSARAAVELALDLARRLGKDPIEVADAPGFASSRLGLVIGLEAIRMVEAGVAAPADIDKAMTLGYGFPMGPLRLTDLVGLDVRLAIAEYLAQELGERFAPPPLLRAMVARGELGKKSGRGFYDWTDAG